MHRYLIQVPLPWGGVFKLPSYGFCIMAGFLLALWLLARRSRARGLKSEDMLDLAVFALFGGVLGARIFYVIEFWHQSFSRNPIAIFEVWQGGLVFYGGMIGGLAVMALIMWRRHLPVRLTFDCVASVVPLAHAFGRLGCFLNGCCYGRPTASHWGVLNLDASREHALALTQRYLPAQLYAVAHNLLIFLILSLVFRKSRKAGVTTAVYIVLYPTARFISEYYRFTPPLLWDMSIAQLVGIPVVAVGLFLFFYSSYLKTVPIAIPPVQPAAAEDAEIQPAQSNPKPKKKGR